MQRKNKPSQSVTVEGNDLQDFMFPANNFEIEKLLDKAKYLGRELKEIILFIALSILLLIGISLLPKSSVPVMEGTATAIPTSIVETTRTATAP